MLKSVGIFSAMAQVLREDALGGRVEAWLPAGGRGEKGRACLAAGLQRYFSAAPPVALQRIDIRRERFFLAGKAKGLPRFQLSGANIARRPSSLQQAPSGQENSRLLLLHRFLLSSVAEGTALHLLELRILCSLLCDAAREDWGCAAREMLDGSSSPSLSAHPRILLAGIRMAVRVLSSRTCFSPSSTIDCREGQALAAAAAAAFEPLQEGEQIGGSLLDASPATNALQLPPQQRFILHLEPGTGSRLQTRLSRLRSEAAAAFGADDTHCYRLHCSVTGFFECKDIGAFQETLKQLAAYLEAEQAKEEAAAGVSACGQERQRPLHGVPRVVSTADGFVLLPLQCSVLQGMVQMLLQRMVPQHIHRLRQKRVDHLTAEEVLGAPWDLVLYEEVRHSAGFLSEGTHAFVELQRFHGLATKLVHYPPTPQHTNSLTAAKKESQSQGIESTAEAGGTRDVTADVLRIMLPEGRRAASSALLAACV
ncbi:hypothetical protein cyc_06580 [Cyclospora cayetanensis]|uniref:Uncharacterized protein n=1 Tax=Cyclospora cayetanensis TaxID=88456 RepID=A0A1D3CR04_9EIME|nr:hypothetical protein cyc_06580 [Cyclospora cayetanensis]